MFECAGVVHAGTRDASMSVITERPGYIRQEVHDQMCCTLRQKLAEIERLREENSALKSALRRLADDAVSTANNLVRIVSQTG